MKIQKKHAVTTTEFLIDYLEDGFWPYDEDEEVLIAKIVAFGSYHNMLKVDKAYRHKLDKIGIGRLPGKSSSARLDITECEAECLIEMIGEYKNSGSVEEPVNCESLLRYLNKTFIVIEDKDD